MNRLVNSHGGNLVRTMQALDGFKAKYGYWPTELYLSSETIGTLKKHLTIDGYRHLSNFVTIVTTEAEGIVAKGHGADEFDYSREGWSEKQPEVSAAVLLGMD